MFSLHCERAASSWTYSRERRGAGLARRLVVIRMLLAWAFLLTAGCERDSGADSGSEPGSGEIGAPGARQSAAANSGTETPPEAAVAVDTAAVTADISPDAEPAPPPQPTQHPEARAPTRTDPADPAATLEGILALQERILARLDSLEAAGAGAGAAADSADEAAGIDLEGARDEVTNLGYGIFWSIVVLLVFHFAIRAVIWVLETLSERSGTRRLTFKWLIPITRMLLWAIAGYLIVSTIFRVDAQGILAASAALGLALGIAAQDLLKNVFGGLIVVFDQPFQVGDKISVGDTYGEVVSIGLRSTRIMTADDDLVSVPNSQVVEEQVANSNAGQLNCQVVTDLYLPGSVDERRAKEIAFEAAVNSKYVFLEKPIQVFIEDEFRTTFVTRVRVRAYVLDPRFEFLLRSDITERARDGFRAAGLAPERDWYPLPFASEASSPDAPDAP